MLLGLYLDQRIEFYINEDDIKREQISQRTSQLQADLWTAVRGVAADQPATPIAALVLSGINDVINSQGYTQAAFWNRIPTAAWLLMAAIALCSNVLFGYRSRKGATRKLSTVLPFVISIAMLLIADIDASRHGLIRISPQNLESLAKSLGR
jgi:predicted exporter